MKTSTGTVAALIKDQVTIYLMSVAAGIENFSLVIGLDPAAK